MRVAIADDSALLREGIAHVLENAGIEVVGRAGDVAGLLATVRAAEPDVVIVDIRMPPTFTDEGVRAAQAIRRDHPSIGVLVLSQHVEPGVAMELFQHLPEGIGYLLKDRVSDLDEFVATVRRIAEGGTALDPDVVEPLIGRVRNRAVLRDLGPEERQVLSLLMQGRPNAEIAARLRITDRAVAIHARSVIAKLSGQASADDQRRVLALLSSLGA